MVVHKVDVDILPGIVRKRDCRLSVMAPIVTVAAAAVLISVSTRAVGYLFNV